jgi:predicted membrane protein
MLKCVQGLLLSILIKFVFLAIKYNNLCNYRNIKNRTMTHLRIELCLYHNIFTFIYFCFFVYCYYFIIIYYYFREKEKERLRRLWEAWGSPPPKVFIEKVKT